jgi:uncharacterized protein YbjT (DUF2867 family)
MKILITGGTGVIGKGLIPALKLRNYDIRLLSRHAVEDVASWEGVEPYPADIRDAAAVGGSAEKCDVVVHITGIDEEHPPDYDFETVNLRGTELVVSEAERAGVRLLVFLSSLGALRGTTEYHRSKSRAEDVVRGFSRDWLILRPSAVYGPGDRHVSKLLRMVRTLPAVPVLGEGDQCIQPVWYEDLGSAIARAIELGEPTHATLSLGGHRTTPKALLELMGEVTGKSPAIISIPPSIALTGTALAEAVGAEIPFNVTQLQMVLEENCVEKPEPNALIGTFGIDPIPLEEGLRILADSMPEQPPEEGRGRLRRKRFSATISGPGISADSLFRMIRADLTELIPIPMGVEPGSAAPIELGTTLTAELWPRGTIQMRVEDLQEHQLTMVTLEGHPLAGLVRILTEKRPGGALAQIEVYARPADLPQWLATKAGASGVQSEMWRDALETIIERSGGSAPDGIESDEATLDDLKGTLIEEWGDRLIAARQRDSLSPNAPTNRLD